MIRDVLSLGWLIALIAVLAAQRAFGQSSSLYAAPEEELARPGWVAQPIQRRPAPVRRSAPAREVAAAEPETPGGAAVATEVDPLSLYFQPGAPGDANTTTVRGRGSVAVTGRPLPEARVALPAGVSRVPVGRARRETRDPLSPEIADVSFTAVKLPDPREFHLRDLITIIVRESVENRSEASMESGKDFDVDGSIEEFPHLKLADLLRFQLQRGNTGANAPEIRLGFAKDFEGDGEYSRRDTFTTRITAQVIDVKPNGLLVLQARKTIVSDKEEMTMVLTGLCDRDAVRADNTILSTEMYDLRLEKYTRGELRKATKKGVISKVFDHMFDF